MSFYNSFDIVRLVREALERQRPTDPSYVDWTFKTHLKTCYGLLDVWKAATEEIREIAIGDGEYCLDEVGKAKQEYEKAEVVLIGVLEEIERYGHWTVEFMGNERLAVDMLVGYRREVDREMDALTQNGTRPNR